MAAVRCAASSFDQSFFRQFIKQNDHAAGEHTESFRQARVGCTREFVAMIRKIPAWRGAIPRPLIRSPKRSAACAPSWASRKAAPVGRVWT